MCFRRLSPTTTMTELLGHLGSWQMAVLVACFALCWIYFRERPSRHALLAVACFTASIVLFNVWVFADDLDYAFKLFNAGINAALVIYLIALFIFIFDPPSANDLTARLLWMIVLVAEAWGLIFNNIGCNLILEDASREEVAESWGTTASKYVCGREVGEWFEYAPLAVELGAIAWIIHRYSEARRKTLPESSRRLSASPA